MATETDPVIVRIIASQKDLEKSLATSVRAVDAAARKMDKTLNSVGKGGGSNIAQFGQNAAKGTQAATQAAQGLSFQLNDIATSLSGGASPFQVMMQQGSQVTQVFQQLKQQGGSIGPAIAGAFTSMLNPISLVSFAFIAVAGYALQYFTGVDSGTKKADDELQKHSDAIRKIIDAWGDLDPATKNALKQMLAVRDARAAIKDVENDIKDLKKEATEQISTGLNFQGTDLGTEQQYKVLDLWQKIAAAQEAGQPAIKETNDLLDYMATIPIDQNIGKLAEQGRKLRDGLKEQWQLTQLLLKLKDAMGKADAQAAEKAKKYADAMEKLKDIAHGPLTEVEKVLEQHKIALENAKDEGEKYAATLAKINALTKLQIDASHELVEGAFSTGGGGASGGADWLKLLRRLEGGGDNSYQQRNTSGPGGRASSSAFGAYQFLDDTWGRVMTQMEPRLLAGAKNWESMSREAKNQVLELRKVPEIQDKAAEFHTKQIDKALQDAGQKITDVNRYVLWHQGIAGGLNVLRGGGVNAAAAAANPTFSTSSRTFVSQQAARVNKAKAALGLEDEQSSLDLDQKKLDVETKITGEGEKQVAARAEQIKYEELIAKYRQQNKDAKVAEGLTAAGVTREQETEARRLAQEAGQIAGQEARNKQAKSVEEANQALKDENETLTQQADAIGALTAAYDANAAAQLAKIDVTKIENDLTKQGIVLTDAQKKSLYDLALANEVLKQKTETAKQGAEDFKKKQEDNRKATEEFVQQIGGVAKTAISGFINDLRNGVSAGEAFGNMIDRIVDGLINMGIESLFSSKAMSGLLGNLASSLGGGFGGGGGGGLYHGGGTVGISGRRDGRRFSPALWASAPKFASGGMVGLRPGEVPIIAHKGELVVPRSMVGKGGGGKTDNSVHQDNRISIDMSGTGMVAANSKDAKQVGENIQLLIQAELVRQSRPGGLLRKVPA